MAKKTRRRTPTEPSYITKRPKGKASRYPGKLDGGKRLGLRLTPEAYKAVEDLSDHLAYTVSDTIEYCIRKTCKLPTEVVKW